MAHQPHTEADRALEEAIGRYRRCNPKSCDRQERGLM
jgi:hypothetical protein